MKSIKYLVIILGSLLLAYLLPQTYHLVTDTASKNIFTYYSSIEKAFCTIDFDEKEERLIRKNLKTNKEYSETEFDSILPMFYSNQLFTDGRMPQVINGEVVNPKRVRSEKFFFRVQPTDKNRPHIDLYTLFESMSGRVRIEMPGDVFRLDSKIEFINSKTNQVNLEKSLRFNRVFEKKGFQFPAKLVKGNPSTRKAYDEGYFIIDNADHIFHLKMVNNMPFLKKVSLPINVMPEYLLTMEPDDRSFYAFIFDTNKKLYIITTDSYKLKEIPIPVYNINQDQLLIMANPLYWNINVITPDAKTVLAIHADSKERVDEVTIKHDIQKNTYDRFVLPFSIRFTNFNTFYIKPVIYWGSIWVLCINVLLLVVFLFIQRYRKQKPELFSVIWIILTGIYGFITNIIFNR